MPRRMVKESKNTAAKPAALRKEASVEGSLKFLARQAIRIAKYPERIKAGTVPFVPVLVSANRIVKRVTNSQFFQSCCSPCILEANQTIKSPSKNVDDQTECKIPSLKSLEQNENMQVLAQDPQRSRALGFAPK